MKERVKITITPSVSDSNLLTVEDAMQQVLDYFDLLRAADRSIDDKEQIIWRLKSVSMNSPFTVVAEPFGHDPSVNVAPYALSVMRRFHNGIHAVIEGDDIPDWLENDKHLYSSLKRNLNGIGRTDIDLGDNINPIIISHKVADDARKNLERRKIDATEDLTHSVHGSIEGVITSVGSHYNKPCFYLRPRLGGKDIRCIVNTEIAASIGSTHSLNEVWENSRIIVEGRIAYDSKGEPVNIDVKDIIRLERKSLNLDRIYDENFTGKLSVKEYQDRLREGELDDN